MEQFKKNWRAFTAKADRALLVLLLVLLYALAFGLARLWAALFSREASGGWKLAEGEPDSLESAKRQS